MSRWFPLLPGILAFLAISCVEEECPAGGNRIELEAEVGEIRYLTRGTPAESVHDAFSVWAWVWETERATPNYLCGELFSRAAGSTWKSALPHGPVPEPYQLQFWALGPAEAPGVHGLPLASTEGVPGFSYTTPTDPGRQVDLMAALSQVYEGMPSVVQLRFSHLLSCLQFGLAEDAPVTVVSVEVTNVCSEGTYREGEGWISESAPDDFRIEGWQDCLLLLPQTLESNSQLRVTVEQGGTQQVLTASLADLFLPIGCRTEIRISFPASGSLQLAVSVVPWTAGPEYQE